jgi:hypothetical protein
MVLGRTVLYLPERLRETTLKQVFAVSDWVVARRAVLSEAAQAWPMRTSVTELNIIRRCLDGTDLDDCFDLLAAGSDLLERIAGDQVYCACLDGVRSVRRWWPHVAA